jgi:hypothetical protein
MSLLSVFLLSLSLPSQPRGDPRRPWALTMDAVAPIHPPSALRASVLDQLEYESGDTIKGIAVDLNRDKLVDYIVQSAPSLCGTGGCIYLVIDGRTKAVIGRVFGDPLYVHEHAARGFPDISAYSHLSAAEGSYSIWRFQHGEYRQTSSRSMHGATLDSLIHSLERIPSWPRPKANDN